MSIIFFDSFSQKKSLSLLKNATHYYWTTLFQLIHGCTVLLNDCFPPDEVAEHKIELFDIVQTEILQLTNNKVS